MVKHFKTDQLIVLIEKFKNQQINFAGFYMNKNILKKI